MRIILASKSPRRKEILENLGLDFDIMSADADETSDITDPDRLVMTLAERKGRAVVALLDEEQKKDCLVIACDTLVYAEEEFLGKPRDREDARRMLGLLSGRSHSVISGIYAFYAGRETCSFASTNVLFDNVSDGDIEKYLDSGEPFDKAGAYAIQGKASVFIRGIEGDYFNVVGLPVNQLYKTLKNSFNIDINDIK